MEAWNCMPRLIEKVLGTFVSRCGLTAHTICVETITPFPCLLEYSFLGFSQTRRRHNASFFSSNMPWQELPLTKYKDNDFP